MHIFSPTYLRRPKFVTVHCLFFVRFNHGDVFLVNWGTPPFTHRNDLPYDSSHRNWRISRGESCYNATAQIKCHANHNMSNAQIWILSNGLMNYIGDISYSLYLVHWPIFVTIKYFYSDNHLGTFILENIQSFISALLAGIGLSLLTASFIYFVYEQPYLKLSPIKIFILVSFRDFVGRPWKVM